MKKRPKITEKTKNNIVNAFWTIYKEKEIDKITVTEIIQKAGYNRSTFYCYFENVQSILSYIEDTILKALNDIIINRNQKNDFEGQDFYDELVNFNRKYGEYIAFLLKKQKEPSFFLKFNKLTKKVFYTVHKETEKDSKMNMKYVFIISAFIGSFIYWNKTNSKKTNEAEFFKLLFKLSDDALNRNN